MARAGRARPAATRCSTSARAPAASRSTWPAPATRSSALDLDARAARRRCASARAALAASTTVAARRRATSTSGRRFGLIIVPMQTDPAARRRGPARRFLAPRRARTCARAALLALALADALDGYRRRRPSPRCPTCARSTAALCSQPAGRRAPTSATACRSSARARPSRRDGRAHRRATTSIALDHVDAADARGRGARGRPARRCRARDDPRHRRATSAARWWSSVPERTLRVCALYPDLMNIYADRGNLLLLERRCAWRGHRLRAARRPALGDRDRPRRARPLLPRRRPGPRPGAVRRRTSSTTKREALHAAAGRGAVMLGVCGGYQLLGHSYVLGDEELPGRRARRPAHRARGRPAADRQRRHRGRAPGLDGPRVLAGFENHGGRTHLGAGEQPLGRVLKGHGNTGAVGLRGRAPRQRHRHLPARPAAAQERVVRRLAGRARRWAWTRRSRRSTTASRTPPTPAARRAAGV